MCISATVSFSMAGLLVAGGAWCVYKARQSDRKYVPLALFPVFVGIQQFIEGYVWTGLGLDSEQMVAGAALAYLFFAWMVWPVWVPYMTGRLEDRVKARELFMCFSWAGAVTGAIFYLPYFWHQDWLKVEIIRHSIAYQCALVTDSFLPPVIPYIFYLFLVGLPPLLSSHRPMKIFGAGLWMGVPLTYFFFSYAHISVLCFFAAIMTVYLIHVIAENRCEEARFLRI